MRTGELEKLFGVSATTIRNWISEFENHLSEQARKVGTKQRTFTEDDILTLATIAKLSADGLGYTDIHERLQAGERVEHPQVANYGVDVRMVPAAAVEQIIDSTETRIELERARAESDQLSIALEQTLQRLSEVEAREQNALQKIEALQNLIADLRERVGRAEAALEEKRRGWFG